MMSGCNALLLCTRRWTPPPPPRPRWTPWSLIFSNALRLTLLGACTFYRAANCGARSPPPRSKPWPAKWPVWTNGCLKSATRWWVTWPKPSRTWSRARAWAWIVGWRSGWKITCGRFESWTPTHSAYISVRLGRVWMPPADFCTSSCWGEGCEWASASCWFNVPWPGWLAWRRRAWRSG